MVQKFVVWLILIEKVWVAKVEKCKILMANLVNFLLLFWNIAGYFLILLAILEYCWLLHNIAGYGS